MKTAPSYSIFPLGDAALLVDFGNVINVDINEIVLQLFQKLKQSPHPFTDVVPAYSTLAVYYNPAKVKTLAAPGKMAFETVAGWVEALMGQPMPAQNNTAGKIRIPVCYAATFAWDIEEVAQCQGISIAEVIALHTQAVYRVYMIGFLPGFAYLGEVAAKLQVPRKQQPRLQVSEGCVGIAGRQTGVYPVSSPGGWQIIGRTPLKMFDKQFENPIRLQPGDAVEFYSITENEFENFKSGHF